MKDSIRVDTQRSEIVGPQDAQDDEIDLMKVVSTLWRGKYWILLSTLLAMLIGGYYAYRVAVPIYTATTKLALESRESSVVSIADVVSGLSTDAGTINTELEVLRSRNLIAKLVKDMGLTEDPIFNARLRPDEGFSLGKGVAAVRALISPPAPAPEPTEEQVLNSTINAMLGVLSVSNPRNSYVFDITVRTPSAQTSAEVANALARLYIEDQLEVKFDRTLQATEWLTARVAELQVQVEASAERLKSFQAGANVIGPEALSALNLQVKGSRDRLAELAANRVDAEQRLTALRAARDTLPMAEIAALANDRSLTLLLSRGDTPEIRATFDDRLDQVIGRLEIDLARDSNQASVLDASIREQEARIAAQSDELVQLQQLEREVEANRLIYEYFLTRLKETSVQEGLQQADSRILSMATIPTIPTEPRRSRILALSAILGLMLGAGALLLREMSNNTFRTGEDLEQFTGLTVMGQIPKIPGRKRTDVVSYLAEKPTSAAAEAVRNLRTSILLSNVDSPPQIILVTSSLPGEGKTTVSIALAQNLAGMGSKVLLVEGDIRRRTFGQYFDISQKDGLLAVVSGEKSLVATVYPHPQFGFDILLGEKSTTNAADVFSSDRFRAFLRDARSAYDFIIIDTPPVLIVPDARVLAQSVDAVIYSVYWDKTTKPQIAEGLRQFRTVGIKVSGLVLEGVNPAGMKRYGYGGKYGGYYSYYAKDYHDN